MNWYINRKTNELVQGKLIDEHILSIRIDDYWELKDASQYGEAKFSDAEGIHIINSACEYAACIPYIPEQKPITLTGDTSTISAKNTFKLLDVDNEPVFPICGTCNARKDSKPDSSLLVDNSYNSYISGGIDQTEGYQKGFEDGIKAELEHLAKLGIVYVKANDSSPVIEGNKNIIPVAEGYGFQISTIEEEAELGKKLISQEEYEECGDDEDMLIAQHNKTVKDMLAAGYKKFIPLSDYRKGEGK